MGLWDSPAHMDDVLQVIEEALRASGRSARRVSLAATGSEDYVRGLRRGRVETLMRFRALCKELGLVFYVGPPFSTGEVDEDRLEEALATLRELLDEAGVELDARGHAKVAAGLYGLLGEKRSPATRSRIRRLVAGFVESDSGSGC